MTEQIYRHTTCKERQQRRREVASLYYEGWSLKDIAANSVYSIRTIERDIEYIESHPEEF